MTSPPGVIIERVVLVLLTLSDEASALSAASWCDRMCAGGLKAAVARADDGEPFAEDQGAAAASTLAVPLTGDAADQSAGATALSSSSFSACTPWSTLARAAPRDCGVVIRAVVQHNHACSVRAQDHAAAYPPPRPPPPLVVGYAMREARERALAEAGLLYFVPRGGAGEGRAVVFMPLDSGGGGSGDQGDDGEVDEHGSGDGCGGKSTPRAAAADDCLVPSIVDVLLHKASDYLSLGRKGEYVISPRLRRLAAAAGANASAAVVDPLGAVARCVFDRRAIASLLEEAFPMGQQQGQETTCSLPLPVNVRGPNQAAFAERPASVGAMASALAAAGLPGPPYIVKTAAACGLPHAHKMTVALSDRGLWDALGGGDNNITTGREPEAPSPSVPFPLVVQEFVDHGGVLHKVYVLGDEVVYAAPPRPSIPDLSQAVEALRKADGGGAAARCGGGSGQLLGAPAAPAAPAAAAALPPHLLTFDALKSLPTLLPWLPAEARQAASAEPLDPAALQAAARRLRQASCSLARSSGGGGGGDHEGGGLSLFGFDVVVARHEWVVVDVNYLPNYRGGGERAAAALREALCRLSAEAKGRRREGGE